MEKRGDLMEHESLAMKIVRKKSGAYELMGFSIRKLRALEEWYLGHNVSKKWTLSKDGSHLILE